MIYKEDGYSYNDLTIIPSGKFTSINSRSECNPFYEDGMLPLFTAPMSCVVNEENFYIWEYYKINAILPRTVKYQTRIKFLIEEKWVAFSLKEFKKLFCKDTYAIKKEAVLLSSKFKVCIDIANGHMKQIYDAITEAKEIAKDAGYSLTIMTGNIANPEFYWEIIDHKIPVDYIRLSIGSGNGCLTSSNTGVHYPIASLIDKCKFYKSEAAWERKTAPKIIADGGIRNYKDINIALALGADYVMVGSLFASIIESSAKLYVTDSLRDNEIKWDEIKREFDLAECKIENADKFLAEYDSLLRSSIKNEGSRLKKRFYGMSTKEAQIEINNALEYPNDFVPKTSEGVAKMLECKYTIRQWTDNFIDYLKSAMSYTDARTLENFKKHTNLIVNSTKAVDSVNK